MNIINSENESLTESKDEINDESITIINDDNFEILNNHIKKKYLINPKKIKTKLNGNSDKIIIKNSSEEERFRNIFQKEYTKNKLFLCENFSQRMEEDIIRRREKQNLMDKYIKQKKQKTSELEKVKLLNRLIQDNNRRLDVKDENLRLKEEKENENINEIMMSINKTNKKYDQEEWNKIYESRFGNYLKNKKSKLEEKKKQIELNLQKEEKELKKIPTFKNKNEAEKIIDDNIKRLYNDFEIRKVKSINKKDDLVCKRYKSLDTEKLNKIMKRKKANKKNKKIFTPSKNFHQYYNDDIKLKFLEIFEGKTRADILINNFLMNHGK